MKPLKFRNNENKFKTAEEIGKAINEWLGIAAKLAVGIGLILIVSYCFFDIGFIPSGLTLADTFLYVSISLGFGFILFIFSSYSTYIFHWLLDPILERQLATILLNIIILAIIILGFCVFFGDDIFKIASITLIAILLITSCYLFFSRHRAYWLVQIRKWNGLYFGSVLLFLLAVAITALAISNKVNSSRIIIFWASAFSAALPWSLALNISNKNPPSVKRTNKGRVRIIIFVLILLGLALPLLQKDFAQTTVGMTFERFGIRMSKVNLALSPENFERLKSGLIFKHDDIKICDNKKGTLPVIYGVDVLWHRLGEKTLIEFSGNPANPFDSSNNNVLSTIDLDRQGVTVLKNITQQVCLESPHVKFEVGKIKLSESLQNDLISKLKKIPTHVKDIDKIEVIGYSDVQEFKYGNQLLSEDRASHIANIVINSGVDAKLVDHYGNGIEDPKVICDSRLKKLKLDECLAPNRRVEIRVFFKPNPIKQKNNS